MRHTACIGWGSLCALLGVAYTAWAQDPAPLLEAAPTAAVDPTTALLVEVLRAGGLPGVLGLLGFAAARVLSGWQPAIRHIIVLEAGDDDTALQRLRERLDQIERG